MKNIIFVLLLTLLINIQPLFAQSNPDFDKYIAQLLYTYRNLASCTPTTINYGKIGSYDSVKKIVKEGDKCSVVNLLGTGVIKKCTMPLEFAKKYGTLKVNEIKNGTFADLGPLERQYERYCVYPLQKN